MWHPLAGYETSTLVWLMVICGGIALFLFVRLEGIGRALRNQVAPLGIVSLANSLSSTESDGILKSWRSEGRRAARRHLSLDYGLIPFFSTSTAVMGILASRWFAQHGHMTFSQLSMVLAWSQWGLALLDFIENTLLLRTIQVYPFVSQQLTNLSGGCARIKTGVIAMMMAVGLFSLLSFLA